MESLYTVNKPGFHQLATHISLYHEPSSPPFQALIDDTLIRCGLKPRTFTTWNVPNMHTLLGKSIPVDVHGKYVLVDEAKALESSTSYGVLRYALLATAIRTKEGGRFRYDFGTMNLSMTVGALSGFGFLWYVRPRSFGRRRPFLSITAACGVCLASLAMTRWALRAFGIGLLVAEKSHKKALTRLECADCMEDVNLYTAGQIQELKNQPLPQSQPGMPPPPEEYVRRFQKGIQTQIKLLEIDMQEVSILRKRVQGSYCGLHKGLREAPQTYTDPSGMPILALERRRAEERLQQAAPSLPPSPPAAASS